MIFVIGVSLRLQNIEVRRDLVLGKVGSKVKRRFLVSAVLMLSVFVPYATR